jgi:hypothetical protein
LLLARHLLRVPIPMHRLQTPGFFRWLWEGPHK